MKEKWLEHDTVFDTYIDKYNSFLKFLFEREHYIVIYDLCSCLKQSLNLPIATQNIWAVSCMKLSNSDEAIGIFRDILSTNSNIAQVHFNLANCYANNNNMKEAIGDS